MRGQPSAPGSDVCLTVRGLMASRERVWAPQHRPRTSSQMGSSPEFRATSSGHPIPEGCRPGKRAEAREHPQVPEVDPVSFSQPAARALPAPWLCCLLHQEGCPPVSEMLRAEKKGPQNSKPGPGGWQWGGPGAERPTLESPAQPGGCGRMGCIRNEPFRGCPRQNRGLNWGGGGDLSRQQWAEATLRWGRHPRARVQTRGH